MTINKKINFEELKRSGVIRLKEENMFSLWIKTSCCNLNSNQLRKLADIIDRYAKGYLLFTTRQIPIIPFVNLNDVAEVKHELSKVYLELDRCGPKVRNINVCYEDKICSEAVANSVSLAEKLDNFFRDPILHKIKIGVAGCKKDCIISKVLTDIGFVAATGNGHAKYDVYVGGKLGLNPFVGLKMGEGLSENACVKFVQNSFDLLRNEGKEGERAGDIINRLGANKVKHVLNKNLKERQMLKPIKCETGLKENTHDKVILRIRATCGEVTSKQLIKIADIAEKYGKSIIHFVVRGNPEIPCIDKTDLESIRRELQEVNLSILDEGIENLQSCFGNYCSESNVDPQSLIRRIEAKVKELKIHNLNIKISASGCPNSCSIAQLNDIGFYGVLEPEVDVNNCNGCELCLSVCKRKAILIKNDVAEINKEKCKYCGQCVAVCPIDALVEKRRGFAVFVGSKEGEEIKLGELIAEFLSEKEALQIAERCLRILKERRASAAAVINEVGLNTFKKMLTKNIESDKITCLSAEKILER